MGKKLLQKAGSIGLPPALPVRARTGVAGDGTAAPGGVVDGVAGADFDRAGGGIAAGAGPDASGAHNAGAAGATGGAGGVGGVGVAGGAAGMGGLGSRVGAGVRLADPGRAKTAPGTMLGFMTAQSAAVQEAEQLRARLAEFDGAAPARRLDPACVVPSRWANRHERSFGDEAFAELKADIAAAGGNVQAIKVRPLQSEAAQALARSGAVVPGQGVGLSNPPALPRPPGAAYEIVFGHRRHRACLELGLPVLAVVETLSEQDLFIQMERENRARKDLSAWEQGVMYARALDQGLYPSNRQLALAIGRDLGDVGKALSLARLPQVVVEAFASPLDLQFRWAKPLSDAQQADPEGLVARAAALRLERQPLAARQVFEALLAAGGSAVGQAATKGVGQSNPLAATVLERDGRTLAVLSTDARQRTHLRIEVPLDDARRRKLLKLLDNLLS
ncbi:ParB/RepB/Spo0J family partition protein [Aquabacterium sp. OR-4]|uniref:ParB/RepB/Spo0J family partition protein n=1 Tax=Aquabacterium sp. OR-4 TaxID=2978127 RepID=UPI0028CAE708|nr:ParB/RepB/Spo0J family partition protein [Aquabacterium sp. OR-4]MDT7838870.1 ParB/RepB/Spo0J family partition protein [Aquabacterium sp. OR-4]